MERETSLNCRLIDINLEDDFGIWGYDSPIVFEVPLKDAHAAIKNNKYLNKEEKEYFIRELGQYSGDKSFMIFSENYRIEVDSRKFS